MMKADPKGLPTVSIVTVTWNHRAELDGYIDALNEARSEVRRCRVESIIVDNASSDQTAEYVSQKIIGGKVLPQTVNTGFAKGCNIGLEAATGDYLLLLNPDAYITAKALDAMVDFLSSHLKVGAVGCRLVHEDGLAQISTYPRFNWLSYIQNQSCVYPLIEKMKKLIPHRTSKKPHKVGTLMGSCIMIPRSVYTKVGGLEPAYFMYFEDADWCERIWKAGYQIAFLPSVEILHRQKSSAKRAREFTYRRVYRSAVEYGNRHLTGLQRTLLDAAMLLDMTVRIPIYGLLRILSPSRREQLSSRIASTKQLIAIIKARNPDLYEDPPP